MNSCYGPEGLGVHCCFLVEFSSLAAHLAGCFSCMLLSWGSCLAPVWDTPSFKHSSAPDGPPFFILTPSKALLCLLANCLCVLTWVALSSMGGGYHGSYCVCVCETCGGPCEYTAGFQNLWVEWRRKQALSRLSLFFVIAGMWGLRPGPGLCGAHMLAPGAPLSIWDQWVSQSRPDWVLAEEQRDLRLGPFGDFPSLVSDWFNWMKKMQLYHVRETLQIFIDQKLLSVVGVCPH